jgi:tetratricopeptide (TPR) repeat protein
MMKFLSGRAVVLCAIIFLSVPSSALANWHVAESDHFVIYADDKAEDLRKFASQLESYHQAMTIVSGRTIEKPSPSNRVTIFVAGDQKDVRKLARTNSRYIQGFYMPRAAGSVAFVQDLKTSNAELSLSMLTLLHEYAHHFLISSMRSTMPRWLSEGAAEFYASARFPSKGGVEIGRPANHRAGELTYADGVTVHELLDPALYDQNKSKKYDEFYGKSWALYHYLTFQENRKGQIGRYWQAMQTGKTSLDAAKEAFGDIDQLDREVSAYLKQRKMKYLTMPPDMITVGQISVRRLSEGAGAVMPLRMVSKRGVTTEEAEELVNEIRLVAQSYPDDAYVLEALAEAEFDAGNDNAAIAAADKAIALDPLRANAYVQKGYALFKVAPDAEDPIAAYKAAMSPFTQLNKLENNHPLPLIYYYRSFVESGREPTDQARLALEQAAEMAPFDKSLWISVAEMQAQEGKIALAIFNLEPIANDPHGGPAAPMARRLIGALKTTPEGQPFRFGSVAPAVDPVADGDGGDDGS